MVCLTTKGVRADRRRSLGWDMDVDEGLLFGPSSELQRLIEHLSSHVMMRIVGRRCNRTIKFLLWAEWSCEQFVGTRLKRHRSTSDMTSLVLGLEDAEPVVTPSVKRTPTTESLVELVNETRAVHRTTVENVLHMCQERADIMYSVKETARKISSPTESDEMNVKRVLRFLSAKCLIEIVRHPKFVNVYTDSDWASQPSTCKSTSGGAGSRTQQTVSLSSAEWRVRCAVHTPRRLQQIAISCKRSDNNKLKNLAQMSLLSSLVRKPLQQVALFCDAAHFMSSESSTSGHSTATMMYWMKKTTNAILDTGRKEYHPGENNYRCKY